MIKADAASLNELAREIRARCDQFLLTINDVYGLTRTLESNWDEEKCGSFREAMDTVKGASIDVETGCNEIIALISEMEDIAKRYNSIKF